MLLGVRGVFEGEGVRTLKNEGVGVPCGRDVEVTEAIFFETVVWTFLVSDNC